jgi:hypothetical protein
MTRTMKERRTDEREPQDRRPSYIRRLALYNPDRYFVVSTDQDYRASPRTWLGYERWDARASDSQNGLIRAYMTDST